MEKKKRFTVFYNEHNNRYILIFYAYIFHEIKILPCFTISFTYCTYFIQLLHKNVTKTKISNSYFL